MPVILGILGLFVGLALDDPVTGILGATVGFLLGAHLVTQKRLTRLEQMLGERPSQKTTPSEAGATRPETPSTLLPEPKAPESPTPSQPPPAESKPPPPQPTPIPADRPAKQPSPAWADRLTQIIMGYFTQGNVVVRVGVIVLFFGVAFLLRYAAERAWIPIELRLAAVALGGLTMLGLGWRLRFHRLGYGLVLQGGGIGVLYLTVFAAFRLYDLLPPVLAFGLLVACALLSALIAVWQDARSLAVAGIAGGFLAPVLASTGEGSHVALFAYYLVLNASILLMAWFKAWRPLNLLGFGFTFVIASLWGYQYYRPDYFASTEPFLILYFLLYVAIPVLFALRQPPKLKGYVDGSLVFGVPLLAFGLQAALVVDYTYGLAWSALTLGAFYLILAWSLLSRASTALHTLAEAFIAIGIVFVTLTIPLALDARWTSAMWALEGAALVWIGSRQDRWLVRGFGALLQLGAGLSHSWAIIPRQDLVAFLNADYLGMVILAAGGFISAFFLWRKRDVLKPQERWLVEILFIWGALWWFGGALREIDLYLSAYRWGSLVMLLAFSALFAHLAARQLSWSLPGYLPRGLLPALGLVVLAEGLRVDHPFAQLGIVAWPLALGVHYGVLYQTEDQPLPARPWFHAGGLWLFTLIITWELAYDVNRAVQGAGTWGLIVWGLIPALVLAHLLRQEPRPPWPLGRHTDTYRNLGGWPLAVYLWCWTLAANMAGPGNPWPLPYFPLFNPLDITVAFVLAILLAWSRAATTGRITLPGELSATHLFGLVGTMAFFWLNGILIRTLHHWAEVPFTVSAMYDSILVQAGLTLLWSLLGVVLMLLAARGQQRRLWLTGAGLMTVVVIKLFVIDLAATGTMERIVAFLAVGILLLIVGYFAPVPPRAADDQEIPKESSA